LLALGTEFDDGQTYDIKLGSDYSFARARHLEVRIMSRDMTLKTEAGMECKTTLTAKSRVINAKCSPVTGNGDKIWIIALAAIDKRGFRGSPLPTNLHSIKYYFITL
jgi:hypothetical protein